MRRRGHYFVHYQDEVRQLLAVAALPAGSSRPNQRYNILFQEGSSQTTSATAVQPIDVFFHTILSSYLCTDGLILFRRPALRGCHQCRQVVLISHLDDIRNRCTPAQCRLFLAPGYNNGSVTFIWPREAADFNLATTYLRVRPCNVGPGSVRVLRL